MQLSSRSAVIIGAGITGTLTAVRLARAGWDVTVLEAFHVGAGSSSRTAAGIRQQFSTPETVLGMRYSVHVYSQFPDTIGGLVVPIVQNGYLFLLQGDTDDAARRVAMQRKCGLKDVELLSAQDTVERFPFVDGSTISGATWCPSDGFLRPEVVYGEAVAAARAYGVQVLQNARVSGSRHEGGRLVEVRAKGAWHGADLFIDCTNAWSPRTALALEATVLPIDPVKRYLWFIARSDSMTGTQLEGMPMVVAPSGAYCHPENSETLMAGKAHEAVAEPHFDVEDQDEIEPEFDHRSGTDSRAYEVWFELAEHMPALADFNGVRATTCGYYGASPDHNPFLGYDPQVSNLLRLVGFSGHGAMFGPFTAQVALTLAEAGHDVRSIGILGREVSLAPFSLSREFRAHEAMVI